MTVLPDPLDPVGYLVDRLVPWQIQLGCIVLLLAAGLIVYFLLL